MAGRLKLRRVGNSVGAIFPREVLAALGVGEGDDLSITPVQGGFQITPYDSEFEKQMEVARKIMKKRRNVLRELAK
jgi:putative addiction module antidote